MPQNPHLSQEFAGAPLVGVTGTFYTDKSDPRFELSLQTSEAYRDQGLPLVVVDGSPSDVSEKEWVAAAHRERGATVLRSEVNGIATQRQQGVRHAMAAGGEKFLTQEPEKTLMPTFAPEVEELLWSHDIVVVGRTTRALESLPPVQRRTERLAGWVLQQTLALPADALAGPRGYTTAGAQHLLKYPAQEPGMNNWIYMYHNPLAALAAGQKVGGVQVDLIHPEAMVSQETGNPVFDRKRYEQFRLQLEYLLPRPEVRPEARHIADMVLGGFSELPQDPTNQDYEDYFARLEAAVSTLGYEEKK